MTALITLPDLAELFDSLGRTEAADLFRYLDQPMVNDTERNDTDRVDDLWAFLDKAPSPSERGKHDEECWRKHVPCLVERIRGLIS